MAKTIAKKEYNIPDIDSFNKIIKYLNKQDDIKVEERNEIIKTIPKIGDEPYYTDYVMGNKFKEMYITTNLIFKKNLLGIFKPILKIRENKNSTYTIIPTKNLTKPVENIINNIELIFGITYQ